MNDQPILKTPGELLGEAREAAGRSLAEIAERTKIPVRQLEAIERDEYHRLSGPLYVKSFLRAYADAVGLDAEQLIELYGRSTGEGAPAAAAAKADVWESETVTITRVGVDWGRLLAWGGGGAALVVGIWFLLRLLSGAGDGAGPAAGAARPQAPPPAGSVVRTGGAATDSAAAVRAGTAGPDSLAAGAAGGGEAVPLAVAPAEPRPEPALPAAGAELPSAPTGSGPIAFAGGGRWPVRVRLLTTAPVAAEVRCDGESRFRAARFAADRDATPALPPRGIEPGRAYAVREGLVVYWRAQDHCGLRLDSTEGVEVSVNGVARDIRSLRPGQEIILDAHR